LIFVAIDRGGTFTDAIAIYKGKIYTKKILSQSTKYKDSNTQAIKELLKDIFNKDYEKINSLLFSQIRLGTTVATNALLEKKGADVSFLVTKGFKDLLEINYQNRNDIFALNIKKNPPLYKEVIEVDERVIPTKDGFKTLKKLKNIPNPKFNSVAVLLMHSYAKKNHEKQIKKALKNKQVSISCEVMPLIKAIERAQTTVIDAYLTPIIKEYISNIISQFNTKPKNLFFIKSDGTLCKDKDFRGANSLLSGPAGGVVALKSIYKDTPLIGFDMGGTSTDVSRFSGEIELKYNQEIDGNLINYPSVDIYTIASGGGSILGLKDNILTVGPKSSGANPGPLCYGRDGILSLSDANVVTNRLPIKALPRIFGKDNKSALNKDLAIKGFKPIAKKLNKSVEELAQAYIDIANEQMANAIKEITLKKGYNPSNHILCSFGGAGGQHAVGVARKLGIKKIFIHSHSGILSAVGILSADIKDEIYKTVQKELKNLNLKKAFDSLIKSYKKSFDSAKRKIFLKYKDTNNSFELKYCKNIEDEFKKVYKRRFGFNLNRDLIVEAIKVEFITFSQKFERQELKGSKLEYYTDKIYLNSTWQECKVYTKLAPNSKIYGPALILQESSTILLDEKSKAFINKYGDIEIELKELKQKRELFKEANLALMSNKIAFIAKKMGDMLQLSAISTNIKERADYSCAIFDSNGDLIANAPHIPVHLGSMSSVIKALIKKFPKINNSTYITNAPYEGGSHLPDITVATPFIKNKKVIFWVASRGHHSDIGGIVSGSMPPFSKSLSDEGAVIEAFEVVKNGKFQEEKLIKIFKKSGAKNINNNISDIKAQIAANNEGIKELKKLDFKLLQEYFKDIKKISAQKIEAFLEKYENQELKAIDYLDNGAKIKLCVKIKNKRAVFDFSKSDFELLSNQNTPPSIVKSAVIYSLRVMLNQDIPLNEGILEPITIKLSKNSLLNPSKNAAVVGGNVTTSQRIVDVILSAFGAAANSNGCMNNIIFGNKHFGYYETIGGGSGATSYISGASGVHTHMTNTKITDTEIIEFRYPVLIEKFAIRKNSGGEGRFRGGDGLIRKYKFLEDNLEVSILSERRVFRPNGLKGGKKAKKGKNILKRKNKKYNLTSKATFKTKKGDILIIKTPGGAGYGKKG
jgi:5-oxoprolinase (ATP-hydrolysing)